MDTRTFDLISDEHLSQDDFIAYPLHKLVTVFHSPESMTAAIGELSTHKFSVTAIEAFCGLKGEKELDLEGVRHGAWASIVRSAQHIGPWRTYLERYEDHLREGHCVMMLEETNEKRIKEAADILHKHTSERTTYFGRLTQSEVQ